MTKTKTNNESSVITSNVDFFQSSRTLATRVAEFFRVIIKKDELNTIYNKKIAANETSIAAIDDMLTNDTKLNVSGEELITMRSNYIDINEDLKAEWERLLKEQATFATNEIDKKFKKGMKTANNIEEVKTLVRAFFKEYKLTIDNTNFENAVLESIGKKVTSKTVVRSEGTKALTYDISNALKNLYGVSFEYMVEAGTIKPADIPSVLVEKYAKKSKSNKKSK